MEEDGRPRKLQKIGDGSAVAPVDEAVAAPERIAEPTHAQLNGQTPEQTATPDTKPDEKPAEESTEGDKYPTGISKNQLKKLKKKEKWEAGREWRKEKRKEKLQAKRERERAAKAKLANNPEAVKGQDGAKHCRRSLTKESRGRSTLVPVSFILDCDFDDLMLDKERISLASQLTRCYADNSKARYRSHLVFSSFSGQLKERFDTVLNKQYEKWKGVTFTGDDFVTAAREVQQRMQSPTGGKLLGSFADQAEAKPEDGEVIYLTSDSPDTLTELKPYHTYIIGGLVDKNRHKGICYKRAIEKNVKTARLPIGDYMQMASRFVLTTNHVAEIMLKWLELGDWGQAFTMVMPKRKGGVLKDQGNETPEADPAETGDDDSRKDETEVAAGNVNRAEERQGEPA